MVETTVVEKSALKVFRNTSTMRNYTLRPREGQKADFLLGPGQTVQALDEAEEKLLEGLGDIVDVAKDAPVIANSLAVLNKQLADEKEKNVKLVAENKALGDKVRGKK